MFDRATLARSFGALIACCLLAPIGAAADDRLVDPTRPAGWKAVSGPADTDADAQVPTLVLQGVFSKAGTRSAVINGTRLGVGDRVNDARVVAIERDRVSLRVNGDLVELHTRVAPVKHPATTHPEMAARLPVRGREGP